MVLRSAGFRLLWMCVRPGAMAAEFSTLWSKAPSCDFGITIYNGNDFISKHKPPESKIQAELKDMVDASACKCKTSFFICNNPEFYPRLDQSDSGFRGCMLKAIDFLQSSSGRNVWQCNSYLRRVKLRDALHFSHESVDMVVRMYLGDFLAMHNLSVDDYIPDIIPKKDDSSSLSAAANSASGQGSTKGVGKRPFPGNAGSSSSSAASNSASGQGARSKRSKACLVSKLHTKYAGARIDLVSSGVKNFENSLVCEIAKPCTDVNDWIARQCRGNYNRYNLNYVPNMRAFEKSFRRNNPSFADHNILSLNCRVFQDPHLNPKLMEHVGAHPCIIQQVVRHEEFLLLLERVLAFIAKNKDSGVPLLVLPVCTSGRHRSEAVRRILSSVLPRLGVVLNVNKMGTELVWRDRGCKWLSCDICNGDSSRLQPFFDEAYAMLGGSVSPLDSEWDASQLKLEEGEPAIACSPEYIRSFRDRIVQILIDQGQQNKVDVDSIILQSPPLRFCRPARFRFYDRRFEQSQKLRVSVCDDCGEVVELSNIKANQSRQVCTFAGNFVDTSWKFLPYALRHEAWSHGLIDARYRCTVNCGMAATGTHHDRRKRTLQGTFVKG